MTTTADLSDDPVAEPDKPAAVWSPAQKLAFRLLFTIGGGIIVLSVYGNLGLAVVMWPLLQALAQLGSYVARGEGVHLALSTSGIPWPRGAFTWAGFWSPW